MIKPKLILMSGLPCVGKSTVAEAIAKQMHLPIFSVDPIESAIIKSGIKKSFETGYAAYLVAESLVREHLSNIGTSVVVDAVNAEQEAKDMWLKLADELSIELRVVHCGLDEVEHKKRVETRQRNLHGIAEVTWDQVQARKKIMTDWQIEVCNIDTANDLKGNVSTAIQFVKK